MSNMQECLDCGVRFPIGASHRGKRGLKHQQGEFENKHLKDVYDATPDVTKRGQSNEKKM